MENIFDLQTDILSLITQHGFADRDFAFVYRDQKIMTIDLSQVSVPEQTAILQDK